MNKPLTFVPSPATTRETSPESDDLGLPLAALMFMYMGMLLVTLGLSS